MPQLLLVQLGPDMRQSYPAAAEVLLFGQMQTDHWDAELLLAALSVAEQEAAAASIAPTTHICHEIEVKLAQECLYGSDALIRGCVVIKIEWQCTT